MVADNLQMLAVGGGVAVDLWRDPGGALEHADEVVQVGDAALLGDGLDRKAGVQQKVLGVGDPLLVHIVRQGHPRLLPEEGREVAGGDVQLAGQRLQAQVGA